MNRDQVRDGPSDSFCSGGNEKGIFKKTEKMGMPGSNNDKGDIIGTSEPNQGGTVSRKKATRQKTEKKRLLGEAPALHVATTKMGGAYSLLTLFKMVKNFNGLTVCLNIMVFSYEMYAHRKFFSYEISVI